MILRLDLPKDLGSLFDYAKKLPFLKRKKELAFRPGLNILFGPNASGKSTVLNMLGTYLAATQGGVTAVTEAWA